VTHRSGKPSTELRRLLRERRAELLAAAARRGASNLRVFGSVARGDDDAGSDIDFLVDFEPTRSLVDVAGLILDLQEILGVPVDVVEASTLRSGDEVILADAIALEPA
jgi:predicted nucleotidyltransferase